jgi:hypothetical protein
MSDDNIENIKQQQEGIKAARLAGIGEVGIFWIYDGMLIPESIPYTEGEDYGEFVNGKTNHYDFWRSVQRIVPKLRDFEYEQIPRGRVIFSRRDGKFHIYGSEQFVKNEAEKKMVLEAFSIAASEAVFRFDEHYSMAADDLPDDSCDDSGRSI